MLKKFSVLYDPLRPSLSTTAHATGRGESFHGDSNRAQWCGRELVPDGESPKGAQAQGKLLWLAQGEPGTKGIVRTMGFLSSEEKEAGGFGNKEGIC